MQVNKYKLSQLLRGISYEDVDEIKLCFSRETTLHGPVLLGKKEMTGPFLTLPVFIIDNAYS